MSQELDIKKLEEEIKNNKHGKKILLLIFVIGIIGFSILIYSSPHLQQQERDNLLRIPRGPDDLRKIHKVISRYTKDNFYYVLCGFCYLYIFLQSFAIPGPVFLSILSGAIFGPYLGFTLVCICATTGATICYTLSYTLGRSLVLKAFPNKLVQFNNQIKSQQDNLFWYMLFMRFTPLFPNWFVNIASPIVGIPVKIFSLGTLLGLIPLNLIHLNAGLQLQSLTEIGAGLKNIAIIGVLGCAALIPTLFKKKAEQYNEKITKQQAEEASSTQATKENKKDN